MSKNIKTLLLIAAAFAAFVVASNEDFPVDRAMGSSAPSVNNTWQQALTCPPRG